MKVTVHPLFFLFGIYFALTGKVFLFLNFTLTAFIHELAHAYAGESLGYKMNKISLMPYGAVVNGNIDGISYRDEIKVAFAGPLANLCICILFTCFWWLAPESYPYLESVVFTNFCIFAINLLPAYPLDGGRILSATLSLYLPRKKAMLITKILGILLAVILLALFVYSIVVQVVNISLLFFALFVLAGSLQKTKENSYIKTFLANEFSLKRIKECKKLVILNTVTLKELISFTNGDYYFSLEVINAKNQKIASLDYLQTKALLATYRLYDNIGDILLELKPEKNELGY